MLLLDLEKVNATVGPGEAVMNTLIGMGTVFVVLILFDNVVIPFVDKYPADTKTYAIMNTKPEESVKQEDVE